MKVKKAIDIVSVLAEGINPYTGEILSNEGPFQNPDTVRALFIAIKALKSLETKEERLNNLPVKAGKPWSAEEDEILIREFDNGSSIKELSQKHERTEGAIKSRLVRHRKLTI